MQLVQISLFDRGSAVKEQVANAVALRESIKKDKNKRVVRNTAGEPVVTGRTVMLMPRKSETKDDLADLTGLEGQALMMFEQEARQALMEASFSHMAKLVASGNYTFDRARVNANGKFALAIKPAIGKAAILSEDDLRKQAAALGFELAPKADGAALPPPIEPGDDGELEVVLTKKQKADAAAKAAAKGKKVPAAHVATKVVGETE